MPTLNDNKVKEECISGVLYNMSPNADYRHSIVKGNIYGNLYPYFKNSLCRVFADDVDLYFDKDSKDYVIPDVLILCDLSKFKSGCYYGIPKFIVEVLSPSTRIKDLTVKKDLYEKHGVEEYWIVDYRAKSVDIYHLIDHKYQLRYAYMLVDDQEAKDYNADISLTLKEFPNMQIKLSDVFQQIS